jgi:antitoxin component YwqK of YwqJK toxin-antitoxin module
LDLFEDMIKAQIIWIVINGILFFSQGDLAFAKTVESYYSDGKISSKIEYNEVGLPNGLARSFAPDGTLISEKRYEDGRLQGISKLYYPSGKIMTEWAYKDEKRDGIALGFYENGKLKDKGYYKNDKLDGIVFKYRKNGVLKTKMNFEKDRPHGIAETYDLNGFLEHEYTYSKGQLILRKTFDQQGKLIRTQEYKPQMISPYR